MRPFGFEDGVRKRGEAWDSVFRPSFAGFVESPEFGFVSLSRKRKSSGGEKSCGSR